MIVAWRVARLMRLGRTAPELDAALLFSTEEWQAAYILAKKRPPKQAPKLNTLIRLIAALGGLLGRKGESFGTLERCDAIARTQARSSAAGGRSSPTDR